MRPSLFFGGCRRRARPGKVAHTRVMRIESGPSLNHDILRMGAPDPIGFDPCQRHGVCELDLAGALLQQVLAGQGPPPVGVDAGLVPGDDAAFVRAREFHRIYDSDAVAGRVPKTNPTCPC